MPFGTFVPTLKIASNSALAQKKAGWIDFDGASGEEQVLWDHVLGAPCKAENEREIAYFRRGVTL